MTKLMQYVDVCIGNEEDAEKVLGLNPGIPILPPEIWRLTVISQYLSRW